MPPRPGVTRGYIDESIRVSAPGLYALAASIVNEDQADELRRALRSCLPRGTVRFHWRNERPATRLQVCGLLVASGVRHVVTVAAPLDPQRQERARRVCLSAMAWELHYRGVRHLELETRSKRDANDRHFLGGEQRLGRVPVALRYEFGQPNQEPLLWAPDAVAGVVAGAFGTGERRYLEVLGSTVEVKELAGPPS